MREGQPTNQASKINAVFCEVLENNVHRRIHFASYCGLPLSCCVLHFINTFFKLVCAVQTGLTKRLEKERVSDFSVSGVAGELYFLQWKARKARNGRRKKLG